MKALVLELDGSMTLRTAFDRWDGNMAQYSYEAKCGEEVLASGDDLRIPATGNPNELEAMRSLLDFLIADGKTYIASRAPETKTFLFGEEVASWAYQASSELEITRMELDESGDVVNVPGPLAGDGDILYTL